MKTTLLLFMLWCAVAAATAQVSEDQARTAASAAIHSPGRFDAWPFFSLHRKEDLEDEFCEFAWIYGSFEKPPCIFFFEANSDGPEFGNGKIRYHTNSDADLQYYVAVSIPSRDVFLIVGVAESREEFNRLASAYRIKISKDNADTYARLYFELVHFRQPVSSPADTMSLKQATEQEFWSSYGDFDTAEREFARWWKKNGKVLGRQSYEWTVAETSAGFRVKFPVLSDIDKKHKARGPALLDGVIDVSKDGQIGEPHFQPAVLH